ncbi:MAG: hypothetical protein AAF802_17130 [Planctomycetota bacterium]
MAKPQKIGVIDDEGFYSAEALSRETGRSLDKVKEKIRELCLFAEPWEGDLWVTGLEWKRGLMKEAKQDTEADREARRARSGASRRRAKKEASE